jgi:16S rRNA (uracil1498-N3)-methyltransferase
MQQYFINQPLALNRTVPLDKDIVFHLKNVLKKRAFSTIRLVDYHAQGFYAQISEDYQEAVITEAIHQKPDTSIQLTLVLALIKKERLEWAIQKASELGVARIVLLESSRCVVKLADKDVEKKLMRYHTIAKEASEVSHRLTIPKIVGPVTIKQLNKYHSQLNLLFYENTDASQIIPPLKDITTITSIIGPEGGFSEDEVLLMESLGYTQTSLTHRVVRSETAAIMACVLLVDDYG